LGSEPRRELAVRGVALINPQSVHLISGRNLSPAGRRGCDSRSAPGWRRGGTPPPRSGVNESPFFSRPRRRGPSSQASWNLVKDSSSAKPRLVHKPGQEDSRPRQDPCSSGVVQFRLQSWEPLRSNLSLCVCAPGSKQVIRDSVPRGRAPLTPHPQPYFVPFPRGVGIGLGDKTAGSCRGGAQRRFPRSTR
jgi:hypothetical protein